MNDPYLKYGVICEVWNAIIPNVEFRDREYRKLKYFHSYNEFVNSPIPLFVDTDPDSGIIQVAKRFDNYRVIGTEWDFAPDWAVCCTIDEDGLITFWSNMEDFSCYSDCWSENKPREELARNFNFLHCGICPDKSRYEGDAWKESLRMRPVWAGGKE